MGCPVADVRDLGAGLVDELLEAVEQIATGYRFDTVACVGAVMVAAYSTPFTIVIFNWQRQRRQTRQSPDLVTTQIKTTRRLSRDDPEIAR